MAEELDQSPKADAAMKLAVHSQSWEEINSTRILEMEVAVVHLRCAEGRGEMAHRTDWYTHGSFAASLVSS